MGLEAATVVLKGWGFDFTHKDHHIDVIGIRLTEVEYDPESGTVEWVAEAELRDKSSDDDFRWRYQWEVIGLPEGEVATFARVGSDGGNTDLDPVTETNSTLSGYDLAVVLPQGWRFDYASKDHETKEIRFGVRNAQYDSDEGRVRWTAVLNYSDQKPADDYTWRYDLAAIAFNGGRFFNWWGGPQRADGGNSANGYSVWIR